MSDFDDLLGGDDTTADKPRAKMGRPTNEERARRLEQAKHDEAFQREVRMAGKGQGQFRPEDFYGLCSQNQIARLMKMDPSTIKRRLERCKPAGMVGAGRPVYYFHEAIPYLVKPKMDIETYLKTLNPYDMPNSINKVFWEAVRIKNKAMIETGEAWPTEDVLEVLGDVFMMFKDRIPLITEGMRDAQLTETQYQKLIGYTDQLQTDLHAALVELPKKQRHLPRSATVQPEHIEPVDSDDDDILGGDE